MGYCLPDSSPFIIGNPETSSWDYNQEEKSCLEDSTSLQTEHPRQSVKSVFDKKLRGGKTNTDSTLSLQKNATQSHKLQNNQGKSMIAEDSFVPLL